MDIQYVLSIIIAIVVAPVALAIGATVTFETTGSIDTTENSYADNTLETIEDKTSTGFSLAAQLPLVIAGVGLISIIAIGFLSLYRRAD